MKGRTSPYKYVVWMCAPDSVSFVLSSRRKLIKLSDYNFHVKNIYSVAAQDFDGHANFNQHFQNAMSTFAQVRTQDR